MALLGALDQLSEFSESFEMPVINGCKYSWYLFSDFLQEYMYSSLGVTQSSRNLTPSSEPCIRGHRATSCAHTDRILIEVRKPGRPLESCGHEFATCTCGKITELLSMGTGRSILFA